MGVITVNIDGLPSQVVTDWALNSKMYKSGVSVLCDSDNNPVEKLFFMDGACTSMIIDFEQDGVGYDKQVAVNSKHGIVVNFRITANVIWFNEKSIFNNWKL